MFVKPDYMRNTEMPKFMINYETINVVNEYPYLGHIITDTLSDNPDIA